MEHTNSGHKVNCEWGLKGIELHKKNSDVIIIVDVLSFSTSVDIAIDRGAVIFPYSFTDETALLYSKQVNARLASRKRSIEEISLSPSSLLMITAGTNLVLPSPNGSELSFVSGSQKVKTITACLRNCRAAAEAAMSFGEKITIIPAGEKWKDGTLRFALEDLIGAGAILSFISGDLSPEARSAVNVFNAVKSDLQKTILGSFSGVELIQMGFPGDVELASELNVSNSVPLLDGNHFENHATLTSILTSKN